MYNLDSEKENSLYDFSVSFSNKDRDNEIVKKEKKEDKFEEKKYLTKEDLFIQKINKTIKKLKNKDDQYIEINNHNKKKDRRKLITLEDENLNWKLSEVEEQNLWRVFNIFLEIKNEVLNSDLNSFNSRDRLNKTNNFKNKKEEEIYFDGYDIKLIWNKLGDENVSQKKIDEMIWEFDENLDKRIDKREFALMYKKCIQLHISHENKNNNQKKIFYNPNGLFTLVQFLMFCKPIEDEDGKIKNQNDFIPYITMEDTYFLIYGRLDREGVKEKRSQLDIEIKKLFGGKEKNEDGTDIRLYFNDYINIMSENLLHVINNFNDEKKNNKINIEKDFNFDKKGFISMRDFISKKNKISDNIKKNLNSKLSKISRVSRVSRISKYN